MNNITKILILSFLLGSFSSLFAVSEETESKLLVRAMLESATSDTQKAAVSKYFTELASAKKEEAKRLRHTATVARGGKMVAQNNHKREFLEKADRLEKQAQAYEKLALGEGLQEYLSSN